MAPMMDEALRRARTRVPATPERPIRRAYEGRKIEGRLYPRDSNMLDDWKKMKVRDLMKV
jgi:hypothetical protein